MADNILRRAWQGALKRIGTSALRAAGITTSSELAKALELAYASSAGPTVTPSNAMTLSTVFACVRNIADDISTLPVAVFKRLPNDEKEIVPDHPVARLLQRPNTYQTRPQFLRWLIGSRTSRGNGLAVKNVVRGRVVELIPEDWGNVEVVKTTTLEPIYRLHRLGRSPIELPRSAVTHLMGFSTDGYVGLSPIEVARDDMGLSMAARGHASRVFKTGGTSRIVIEHEKNFGMGEQGRKAAESFRTSFEKAWGGERSANVVVLEDNMKAKAISLSPEDLQFLQSREFQVEEVARWFRMAPHMIQHLARATNNNIEQQSLEHVTYTLRPIIVDAEHVLTHDLIGPNSDYFIEFNVNGLLRGNIKDRFLAYATGRQWGWLSVNDIRRWENMNGIGATGDRYLEPVNMIKAGEETAERLGDKPAKDREPDENARATLLGTERADTRSER